MPRWLGAATFLAVVFGAWAALHVYVYYRVTAAFDPGLHARTYFKIALWVLATLYLAGRAVQTGVSQGAGTVILWPGALYLGFFAMYVTTSLAFDACVTLPLWLVQKAGVSQLRGAFYACVHWSPAVVAVLAIAMSVHGAVTAAAGPKVTRIEKRIAGLAPELDGFRIVLLSDVHVGGLVDLDYLDRVLERVRGIEPDLVLLAGDLTDQPEGGDGAAIRRLAAIPATHGVYAVTGNHEMYTGGGATVENYERNGLRMLRQEHVVVAGGLVVAGVDDPSFIGGRAQVPASFRDALAGAPPDLPRILVAHEPVAWRKAASMGVDLMLCGHTHGGQIFPLHVMSYLAYGVVTGRREVGDMTLYVNNGAGYWGPPMRVLADPQILLVTLKADSIHQEE